MISSDGALFFAWHGLLFALLAATCFALGRGLLRGFDAGSLRQEFGLEELGLSIGLGLGTAGMGLFALGLLGLLTLPAVLAGFALVHAHAALRGTWRETRDRVRRALAGGKIGRDFLPWIPAAAVCLLAAALSVYPPTGFDATAYHLPFARAFAQAHRLVVLPARRFPVFPQLGESGFSAMMLLSDDAGAQEAELLAFLAALAALAGWARRKGGPAAGAWAAAAWAGCPAVALFAATAYVDLGFALFFVLAMLAWERWIDGTGWRWAALSGIFAGFAAGTKYHGLFVVALLGAMTIGACILRRRGIAPAGAFAGAAFAAGAPWYVRNFLLTGNPVFPFFSRVFGASPYSLAIDAVTPGGTAASDASLTFARAAREWLGAPLRVARSFSGIPGMSGQAPLSPFLILLAFGAAVAALRNASIRRIVLFAAAYAVACGGAEVRCLIPSAALIALAGAAAAAGFAGARAARSAVLRAAVAAILALPGAGWAAHRLGRLGPIPVRPGERNAFLRRQFAPYPALEYLNRSRGRAYTVYAAGAENLAYFAEGKFLGDWFGPYSYGRIYGSPPFDAPTLDGNLRRIGAGYLLVNLQRVRPPADDDEFRRRFRERLRGPGFALYERGP